MSTKPKLTQLGMLLRGQKMAYGLWRDPRAAAKKLGIEVFAEFNHGRGTSIVVDEDTALQAIKAWKEKESITEPAPRAEVGAPGLLHLQAELHAINQTLNVLIQAQNRVADSLAVIAKDLGINPATEKKEEQGHAA